MAPEKDLKAILGKLKYSDAAKVIQPMTEQTEQVRARMASIKHKLVVMSGKGGVGKSMTTVNLALALARLGNKVDLLDGDLNGPCVPRMVGMHGQSLTMTPSGATPPVGPLGMKVASMDFFLGDASPVRGKGPMDVSPVWLGLMEMNVIREFLADVAWGELDYLLADLPPGAAADKPPVIAGFIPDLAGAIVVTTPSEVASDVVQKSITYARDMGIKVLGMVENMSEYRCPSCGVESELFEGDTLPPATAFWSHTLYDTKNGFFIPNDRRKYSVGENAGMKLADDGGIEIHIAATRPDGVPEENWLPITRQDEEIDAVLRIYVPDMEKMKTWTAPKAERVGGPS